MTGAKRSSLAGLLRLASLYALLVAWMALARPTPRGVTVGFSIALVGEALRVWAAGHLVKTKRLILAGPYLYTRNPLYLGRLMIFTGLSVMASLPYHANYAVLALGLGVFFGYYLPRKERVEPERLRRAHGEKYERYFRAVPALLPASAPYGEESGDGWSSERLTRNREHWMIVALLAVSGFLLWRAY